MNQENGFNNSIGNLSETDSVPVNESPLQNNLNSNNQSMTESGGTTQVQSAFESGTNSQMQSSSASIETVSIVNASSGETSPQAPISNPNLMSGNNFNNQTGSINNNNSSKVIFIVIGLIVLVGILFILIKTLNVKKSEKPVNEQSKSNVIEKSPESKDINYINKTGGSDNKLAILTLIGSPHYVLTIDVDGKLELPEDILTSISDGNSNFEILIDELSFTFKANDLNIETSKYEKVNFDVNILRQEGNWYLIQSETDGEEPIILLKLPYRNSNFIDWMKFSLSKDGVSEGINSQYFDELIRIVNVYFADDYDHDTGQTLDDYSLASYLDYDGNAVDLSDYTFLYDYIAKNLLKYNIYLRDPLSIFGVSNFMTLHYASASNNNYFVSFIDESLYEYYTKNSKKYGTDIINSIKYEIYLDEMNLYLFRKIDDKYMRIECNIASADEVENKLVQLENEFL